MLPISINTFGDFFGVITIIFIIAIISSLMGMMFQKFMEPNMIAFPWAVLLFKIAKKGEIWRHLMRPLGRCRYCNSIWIMMFIFKYIFGLHIFIFLSMGLTFGLVYFWDTYVMKDIDPNGKVEKIYNYEWEIKFTPWQAMMKSYIILICPYVIVYIAPVIW